MRQQDLFKICHGCNEEIRGEHWYVRLEDKYVHFHPLCYTQYKRTGKIRWAIHKPANN